MGSPPRHHRSRRRPHRRQLLAGAAVALLLAACSSSGTGTGTGTGVDLADTATTEAEAALVAAITDRLLLAVDVAETKWNSGAAIEDLAREAEAITAIEAAAVEAGVAPPEAAAALRAQIEASKTIQRALHDRWATEGRGPFDSTRDLRQEIRPELDLATLAMLQALGRVALPIPADHLDDHAAAARARLAEVPDADVAVEEALHPFG